MDSQTLSELADLELDGKQLAGVLRILSRAMAKEEARLEAQRQRKAKSRDKNVTVTGQERDCHSDIEKSSPPLSPPSLSPTPPNSPPPISPPTEENARAKPVAKTGKGSRLTDDWRPPPEYIAFALTEGFSEAEAHREADRFRDYWIGKTGQQACKRDWFATWRNWCRNSNDKRSGASGPAGGTGGRNGGHADPVRIRNQLIRELTPEDDVSTDGRQLQRAGWR